MKDNPCNRCRTHSGLEELCRVNPKRSITYKAECLKGKTELRTKIFDFLFNMKRGAKVSIINDEQKLWVGDFVQLHGFEEGVSITSDNKFVKKYQFLNRDYENNSKRRKKD